MPRGRRGRVDGGAAGPAPGHVQPAAPRRTLEPADLVPAPIIATWARLSPSPARTCPAAAGPPPRRRPAAVRRAALARLAGADRRPMLRRATGAGDSRGPDAPRECSLDSQRLQSDSLGRGSAATCSPLPAGWTAARTSTSMRCSTRPALQAGAAVREALLAARRPSRYTRRTRLAVPDAVFHPAAHLLAATVRDQLVRELRPGRRAGRQPLRAAWVSALPARPTGVATVLAAAVLHDLILLEDPASGFPRPSSQRAIGTRVGRLADLDLLACVSAYTARSANEPRRRPGRAPRGHRWRSRAGDGAGHLRARPAAVSAPRRGLRRRRRPAQQRGQPARGVRRPAGALRREHLLSLIEPRSPRASCGWRGPAAPWSERGEVVLIGRLDDADLAAPYGGTRVVAMPSYGEGLGLLVLEASASARRWWPAPHGAARGRGPGRRDGRSRRRLGDDGGAGRGAFRRPPLARPRAHLLERRGTSRGTGWPACWSLLSPIRLGRLRGDWLGHGGRAGHRGLGSRWYPLAPAYVGHRPAPRGHGRCARGARRRHRRRSGGQYPAPGATCKSRLPSSTPPRSTSGCRPVGNSPFHEFQLPLLRQVPGVVVLHDTVLVDWLRHSFEPGSDALRSLAYRENGVRGWRDGTFSGIELVARPSACSCTRSERRSSSWPVPRFRPTWSASLRWWTTRPPARTGRRPGLGSAWRTATCWSRPSAGSTGQADARRPGGPGDADPGPPRAEGRCRRGRRRRRLPARGPRRRGPYRRDRHRRPVRRLVRRLGRGDRCRRAAAGGGARRDLGALVEAMAGGAALVVEDAGTFPELVGDVGVVLPSPPAVADVARAVAALVDDPAGLAARAARTRQRADRRHGTAVAAVAYRDVVEGHYRRRIPGPSWTRCWPRRSTTSGVPPRCAALPPTAVTGPATGWSSTSPSWWCRTTPPASSA